jgi:hypothetical protein
MLTRKQFLRSGLALASAPLALQARSSPAGEESDEALVRRTWRPADVATGDSAAIRRELVRYATLAPSSHNTQCWKFRIEQDAIAIGPDLSRRTPSVDPDDHHLHVSLGCAAENLVQAALAHGLNASGNGSASAARRRFGPAMACTASPPKQHPAIIVRGPRPRAGPARVVLPLDVAQVPAIRSTG